MKRFMKGCAITALILVVLGIILAAVAGTVRGRIAIGNTVEAITGGRVQVNLDRISDWGITVGDKVMEQITDEGHYDIEDSMIFDDSYEIMQGDIEKYSLGSEARELKMEIGGCELQVKESEDMNFYLEAENMKKLQGYVKDNTLHIKATRSGSVWHEGDNYTITLYVPQNYFFDRADIEVGAGVIELGDLSAEEINFEVGAGQITTGYLQAKKLDASVGMGELVIAGMQVQELDVEAGMGHIYLEGEYSEKINVECSMGSVEMVLAGSQEYYDYNIECGMGSIEIGEDSYSGVAQEKHINNQGLGKMNVECAMGSVEISFNE